MFNIPLIGAMAPTPDMLPERKRDWRASLFDRLNPDDTMGLSDADKSKLGRQALLGLASGLLGTGGGFGNALGAGIQSGLLAINQGADNVVNDRYRQAMMARTMQGMDRNTQIEAMRGELLKPDGQLDEVKFRQYAAVDPQGAKDFREAINGPQTRWQMGRIGDGSGGEVDVLFDPMDPSKIMTIDGQPIGGGSLLGSAASTQTPQFGILRDAVEQVESGGNPLAVSTAGAIGPMQTMPGTLRDPGYGVAPARDGSIDEQRRVGNDYLQAMLNEYADPRLALAAYNAGPGRVNQAMAGGGGVDGALSRLPQETRDYVPKVLGRAGVAQAQPMGLGRRPKVAAAASEETFGQPQEVVDPATGKPALVQFGNRGTVRPVTGFGAPQNAAAANKEAMQSEKQVTNLSKRLSDENVPFVDTSLNTIEGMLRDYTDANGNVVKDIPGYGRMDSFTPDAVAGQEARDLRQTVAGLANTILKSRSGAAVTDNELRRFLQEAGTNKGMPEQQLVNGMKMIRKWFNAQKQNIRGGYSPAVLEQYYQNSPENAGLLGEVAPPAAAGKRLKFNPKTGKLE